MKRLLLLSLLFLLLSCKKEPMICCVNIDLSINLKLLDTQGANYLDSKDAFPVEQMKLYHLDESGNEHLYYRGSGVNNNGVYLVNAKEKFLQFHSSQELQSDGLASSILEIDGYKRITLKAKIYDGEKEKHNNANILIQEVYMDGKKLERVAGQLYYEIKLQKNPEK